MCISKVHKSLDRGLPKMRPILSAIGTAPYNLAKFLIPILSALVKGPYSIINSFTFNKEVLKQDPNLVMGSLDVEALFTNIPLNETVDICIKELYKDKIYIDKLSREDMKKLLDLATRNSLFLFDGVFYNQVDGVAMGSPLGPTLANIFMNYYEQKWLDTCPLEFKPKYYRRYVDDIFVMCETVEKLTLFKDYLNSKHENITFTSEVEIDGKIPFLDMMINRNNGKMVTSVYRKPTFTGVYTHFHSFIPSVYKFGLLSTLLFRYFTLQSNYVLFHLEVVELKKIFLKNGYPSRFIDTCIKKFREKMLRKEILVDTVPKEEYSISLPYLGPLSNKTFKRIKNVFQKVLPSGKINIVFKTQCRLSQFFKFKDAIPSDLVSHVVYHYKCPSCNAGYIGETSVHSKVRWCQHLGISCFTGSPVVTSSDSAILDHLKKRKCNSDLNNFRVLTKESDSNKRLIKESILIKFYDYDLNKQVNSFKLELF